MSRTMRRQTILISIFLALVVLFVALFRMAVVRGDSMDPTYRDGQVLLVMRRGLFSTRLSRGDVVLVRRERDVIIKRIYRLPGEEVSQPALREAALKTPLYGRPLSDYYEQPLTQLEKGQAPRLFVPEGSLMVIGDNLRVSEDSRLFGPVPLRDVLGVVINAAPPPFDLDAMPNPAPQAQRFSQGDKPGRKEIAQLE